jgi:hypothetical protein
MKLDDRYTDFQFWENDTLEKIKNLPGPRQFWQPYSINMVMTSFDRVEEML